MHFHTCKLPAIYYIISCCSGVAGIYDIPFNDAGSLNAKRVEPIEKFSWPSGRSVTLSVFDPDSDPLATTAKKASFCDKNAASYDMNNNDSTQLWIPPTDSSLQELRSFIFQHEGHIFDCLLSVRFLNVPISYV